MNTNNESTVPDLENCGCIYVAFGWEYLLLAINSALTLKHHNSGLKIALVTNVPVVTFKKKSVEHVFDEILFRDVPSEENRLSKLSVDLLSPYEKTLYLDADTVILGDVTPLFLLIERFDFGARLQTKPASAVFEVLPGITAQELHLPEWNGGVILFRKTPKAHSVFKRWRELYIAEGKDRDQPSLARSILSEPGLSFLPLSPMWNAKPTPAYEKYYFEKSPHLIKILHYREPVLFPVIACGIYHNFIKTTKTVDYGLCASIDRAEKLRSELKRCETQYYFYNILLSPFKGIAGYRIVNWKRGIIVKKGLQLIYAVRRILGKKDELAFGRQRQIQGSKFLRASDEG